MAGGVLAPVVLWAQRKDSLWVTISVEDVQDMKLDLTEDKLVFSGVGGTEKRHYAITIEFHDKVNPDESKRTVTGREIVMYIKKAQDGAYWPRLLKEGGRHNWLKTDFNRWRDEDDSDDEGKDRGLEDMMAQMGGFGGAGMDGMDDLDDEEGAGDPDSDDEDMPDLE